MHRSTPLDPGSDIGIQQPVDLFLGQSMGDIRCKRQKIWGAEGRNLETLLDEMRRVFSNQSEGKRGLVSVVSERERGRSGPLRQGLSWLDRHQCAICKKDGKINAQHEDVVAVRKREK